MNSNQTDQIWRITIRQKLSEWNISHYIVCTIMVWSLAPPCIMTGNSFTICSIFWKLCFVANKMYSFSVWYVLQQCCTPYFVKLLLKTKMIFQAEAGGGEREAVGRKTRRPEPWLAGQPRRLHAPVHQVGHNQDGWEFEMMLTIALCNLHAPFHQAGHHQDG